MNPSICPRPGLRPGAPSSIRDARTSYQGRRTLVNRGPSRRPSRVSASRPTLTCRGLALWLGFLRLIAHNGHSYGRGFWGGN